MKLEKWWSKELQIPPPHKSKEGRHKLSESTFFLEPSKACSNADDAYPNTLPPPTPTHTLILGKNSKLCRVFNLPSPAPYSPVYW